MLRLAFLPRQGSLSLAALGLLLLALSGDAPAQSLGNTGTIEGKVTDPSGGMVTKAQVTVRNAVSGYSQSAESGRNGSFPLTNIPPNPYRLDVTASGFATFAQNVDVRNAIPIPIKATLALAGASPPSLWKAELSTPSKTTPRRTSMLTGHRCSRLRPSMHAGA
jgi:hypothetical protein